MNRSIVLILLSIMALCAGCTTSEPSRDEFVVRPSFLNVHLFADRLIYDNDSDSTYCSTLRLLLGRDSSALSAIEHSSTDNPEHAYLLAAYHYRDGDYESMLRYLRTAAARLPQARCDLGLCHKLGIGTRRDPQLAQKHLKEASAQGCTEADYYLIRPDIFDALYRYNATDMIDRDNIAMITERLHRPADNGNARACYYLGVLYYLQSITDNNPHSQTEAIKYLRTAADYGIQKAIEMVNEYKSTNKICQLQYAFIIDDDNARTAYLQGSNLYINSTDESDETKKERMRIEAVNYLHTASKNGIRRAAEMVEEYHKTNHIYRLEYIDMQIIDNDNYALSDNGKIILS